MTPEGRIGALVIDDEELAQQLVRELPAVRYGDRGRLKVRAAGRYRVWLWLPAETAP
jgi:hypothetical protein